MHNSNDIMLSVRSRFVDLILDGAKDLELRRRNMRISPKTRVWIYETLPTAKIRAVASVSAVETLAIDEMWARYHHRIGLSRPDYDAYLVGANVACGLVLENVRELSEPITLSDLRKQAPEFHPPQFYRKLWRGEAIHSFLTETALTNYIGAQPELKWCA